MMFESDCATKSKKKTRSKCLREDEQLHIVPKAKKRENYVSYPTDDEHVGNPGLNDAKSTKKTRRNTLKEQNINIQSSETENIILDTRKPNRVTRQTRKWAENNPEDASIGDQAIAEVPEKKRNKKSKKKIKRHSGSLNDNDTEPVVAEKASIKSKKIKRRSNSIVKVSNISTDSFHSAAGSPLKENMDVPIISIGKSSENQKANTTFEIEDALDSMNTTFEKDTKRSKKSSMKNSTFSKIDCPGSHGKRQSSMFNKVGSMNIEKTDNLNSTSETEPKTRHSLRSLMDSATTIVTDTKLNAVFGKTIKTRSTAVSMESTYDKEVKLDSTYGKNEMSSSKSSLISSDIPVNVTFDKSDNSRISITSDDSKTENIINSTPVLIESSMDDSNHLERINVSNKTKTPDKSIQEVLPSLTPLKREGTFTKEGPEVTITPPKLKISSERPHTERMTLLSPGFTPYRTSQTSQKEKRSLLNVTRSVEKTSTRSSLAELVPRQTRVMFCSPVNSPGVMSQQKKKIIKSSMKGSNKRFLFEENGKHAYICH